MLSQNKFFKFLKIYISQLRMQEDRYDGAPNMSSNTVGMQGRVLQISTLATYIHCNVHC